MGTSQKHRTHLPDWLELPAEGMMMILLRLGVIDRLEVAKVCMTWRNICKDPFLWRSIDMRVSVSRSFIDPIQKDLYLRSMCLLVVDWSCGQLNDLSLDSFADGKLVSHIADRAPQLRRLQLVACTGFLGCEVARKLPKLEELHLSFTTVSRLALESFGRCCPQLKSLKYDFCGPSMKDERNNQALAIAQTMPGLHHLSLIGYQRMTNDGLDAILNQCPHLESLDLRRCYKVKLGGDLGRTCAQRIKNLRYPYDSTEGYEFDHII